MWGRPLVPMERPVQDVDVGTEAAFKFLIELIDNGKERIRRDGFSHRADLVDAFLRQVLLFFSKSSTVRLRSVCRVFSFRAFWASTWPP